MAAAVVFLAVSSACRQAPAPASNASLKHGALAHANVLLVTIDTLRADRVGAYSSSAAGVTPTLDRLAAGGVRFAQAHAHAPMTLPAHTSIMTGLIPPSHGVRNNGSAALSTVTPTLATTLHDAGYRTGAFVGAFVLDARFGLARGFDVYDDRVGSDTGPVTFAVAERTADKVTQLAGDWIAQITNPPTANRPWFGWVHLFDPHAPYRAPVQRVADPYANEVAFADAELGTLLDRLRGAGQLDRTLVVVVADHGESLGEHGEATHGLFAYESTLKIPFIVAGPSISPIVVDSAASQADVLPTVLDLLGLAAPARLDGQSLLAAIRGEQVPARPIYFEALDAYLTRNWAPLTGIVAGDWKYIDLPDAELYNLRDDSGEQRNVIQAEAPRVAALERDLATWKQVRAAQAPARPAIDADAAARLRSLGYAGTQSSGPRGKTFTPADDPKHLLDLESRYQRALTLTGEANLPEAARLLQSVIADRPDFPVAYLNLASVYMAGGAPQRAVALLEDAAKRGVLSRELQGRLGAAYLQSGDAARAVATLQPIAKPETAGGLDAMNTLAIALTERGRQDEARRLLNDVLSHSPRSATTWNNLGLLELAAKRPHEAARAFEQAVADDERLAQAWEGLGAARAQSDPSGAITAWVHAADLDPRNYDVLFNLAAMLHDQGRTGEARPYIERFVREAPPDRYARDISTMKGWLAR